MLPTKKEMEEFVKEIPRTPLGKLEALNKFFLKEKNMEDAFKQMALFFQDLMGNNPAYFEAMKNCRTEEEIKQKSKEFFDNHPEMVEEVLLSMLAVKRDKWEEKEREKETKEGGEGEKKMEEREKKEKVMRENGKEEKERELKKEQEEES